MSTSTYQEISLTGPRFDWRWTLLFGVSSVILGLILVLNPFTSALTLALLIGFGLLANGALAILASRRRNSRLELVVGIVFIVGGIIGLVWPEATLWAIAVAIGLCIIVAGLVEAFAAVVARRTFHGWLWLLVRGVIGVVVGIIAIAWPKATVFVLAFLFGIQVTAFGVVAIANAFEERRSLRDAQ